jgi:prolipoprotein diacylglyceryl transferase
MVRWNVNPEIIHFGFVSIRYYSLLFMLSFIIGIIIFHWIYKKENKPVADIDQLFMYMIFGTVLGARLGHCLFYDPSYYLSNPVKILKVWEGGLASHGAAIGILAALYFYANKRKDQPFLWLVDRIVIGVALAGFFIRLGNLFNSEIIGIPTDVPWAFIFVRIDNIPRHPAQLYEALACLIIFIALIALYKSKGAKTKRGFLLGLFLILIFGFRFFVEFLKESQSAFEQNMVLNMGQLLSIPLVILGIIIISRAKVPAESELKSHPKRKKPQVR